MSYEAISLLARARDSLMEKVEEFSPQLPKNPYAYWEFYVARTENSRIRISCDKEGDHVRISLTDCETEFTGDPFSEEAEIWLQESIRCIREASLKSE